MWEPAKPSNATVVPDDAQQTKIYASMHGGLVRHRVKARRWLSSLTLIFSNAILALLVWLAAYDLQGIWRWGHLYAIAVLVTPSVAVWIAVRLLIGLYTNYDTSPPERLRRHSYPVFATLAIGCGGSVSATGPW